MRTTPICALVVLLAACGIQRADSVEPQPASAVGLTDRVVELTDEEDSWCMENPFEHGEAARALGIRVVGDYVRESTEAGGPDLSDWEPPILAIPADGSEALTYVIRFDDQRDSDRACRAAFDGR